MGNIKITEYSELTGSASNDLLEIVDVSACSNKKITVANLFSTPDVVTSTSIADEAVTSLKNKMTVGCRVYMGSAQSVNSVTWTKINFDTEEFDISDNYDTTNKRFVAPVDGYYCVSVMCEVSNIDVGKQMQVGIYKNGTQIAGTKGYGPVANDDPGACVTTLVYLSASQYVEGYVYHTSAGAESLLTSVAQTNMSVFMVGQA